MTYLPTLKLMGRSTANKESFKDGLIYYVHRFGCIHVYEESQVMLAAASAVFVPHHYENTPIQYTEII